MNRPRRIHFARVSVLLLVFAAPLAAKQEAPPADPASATQNSSSKEKPSKKKYSHADDFLIRGTVFNEKAFSFPGVEVRFRREGQKKYKWETYTNSRGEFAQRVPQGTKYEILVHMKGFMDQGRTIDAQGGGNEEDVVFRMEPIARNTK